MNFIKKFAKEISVFGLVLLIFLGLFIYRQATFKDYKTISESRLTQMIKDQEDFVVVLGDSTDSTNVSYPATFVIKDGKVVAKKEGYNQYYSLYDFIKENFK